MAEQPPNADPSPGLGHGPDLCLDSRVLERPNILLLFWSRRESLGGLKEPIDRTAPLFVEVFLYFVGSLIHLAIGRCDIRILRELLLLNGGLDR